MKEHFCKVPSAPLSAGGFLKQLLCCVTMFSRPDCPITDDDSWDLVTCFCMKPFAGRAMIECNQCNTWIHLSCAKIRKSNVPETYTCQRCKDSKFDIRRSNRSRMGSRKHLLD